MWKRLNKWIFAVSLILFIPACWQRDSFPDPLLVVPELLKEPRQQAVEISPFTLQRNGVDYRIQPLYEYELYGLVVSYQFHDSRFGLHKLWNDHLNVADVCVLWGDNVRQLDLDDFDFWNGQFTCNVSTGSSEAWSKFNMFQLSNNHLILDDPGLRDQLEDIRIGDQIRLRGWLAEYSHGGGKRGTSTTREDTGNGACETLFVRDYTLLGSMHNGWRPLMMLSLLMLVITSLFWSVTVLRGRW